MPSPGPVTQRDHRRHNREVSSFPDALVHLRDVELISLQPAGGHFQADAGRPPQPHHPDVHLLLP